MSQSQSGILHNGGIPNGPLIHLPLEELRVKVLIIDVSARVTLIQRYINPSDTTTSRCKYYFPVPASAAVCAFDMKTWDGRVIKGLSQEKDVARETYERAVHAGQFAGLVDYVTDDVFTISLGCIPGHETVETKLVYVMSLVNDDNEDEVRFQVPTFVGQRYGIPPSGLEVAVAPSSHTRVSITADIQTCGRIEAIISPSHPDISETRYSTHLGRLSRRRSTVKFRSNSFLERDFMLIVRAEKLDSPRCFAELQHDPNGRAPDTIAMQLTIVPKFDLPPVDAQEYLFLVDRSGSMSGGRIDHAKRTLVMLLRMIPAQGSIFNIFSFGTDSTSLWRQSCQYDQASLNAATQHVESIQADYGGTEIRKALNGVFGKRSKQLPAAIFLLTDGESYDIDETMADVGGEVKNAPPHSPLRIFTLGIGDGVSSAMCEGIARAGNGVCLFSIDAESIIGKCARLFRAGRTPFVNNVFIDWGVPDEQLGVRTPSFNLSNRSSTSTLVQLRSPPTIQQAPTQIHDIHAGTRMNVFAIMTLRKAKANTPQQVTLRGQLDSTGGAFELIVPIMSAQLSDGEPGLPLVHTLAAWRLIQEHEEGRAHLPQALGIATDDEKRKAAIVRLGTTYQLVSRHTSFVAVDAGQDDTRRRHSPESTRRSLSPDGPEDEPEPTGGTSLGILSSVVRNFIFGVFGSTRNVGMARESVPGAWPDASSSAASVNNSDEPGGSHGSTDSFSTLSSLEGSSASNWSDWSVPESPHPPLSSTGEDERMQRSPSPQVEPMNLAPENEPRIPQRPRPVLPLAPPPVRPEVVELVRIQSYDGSFPWDNSLREIVGSDAMDEANVLQVDKIVWATALGVAFITKHMGNQRELLNDLLAKPLEFLRGIGDAGELIRRAKALLL